MRRFFGAFNTDIIEEKVFNLVYYCGFTEKDARNLPLYKYRWWIERVNKERKEQAKQSENQGIDLNNVEGLPRNSVPMNNLKMR